MTASHHLFLVSAKGQEKSLKRPAKKQAKKIKPA
jgi:hypothetical protein